MLHFILDVVAARCACDRQAMARSTAIMAASAAVAGGRLP